MTIKQIYTWVLENDPSDENTNKMVWSNMASYCYFINSIYVNALPEDILVNIMNMASKNDIQIPDHNHKKILKLANTSSIDAMISELKVLSLQNETA